MIAEIKTDRGGNGVKGLPEERAVTLAQYIIEQNATVRQAAKRFAVSKSTVHKDVTIRLRQLSPQLHEQVKQVLERNKQERHIRGGMATKEKYEHIRMIRDSGRESGKTGEICPMEAGTKMK